MKCLAQLVCLAVLPAWAFSAEAATLNVGPARTYTRIQDAINVAQTGDVILVDSGTYVGRNCTMLFDGPSGITVRGSGPTRPVLDMGPDHSVSIWGKGICTATARSSDITFENLEFIHAAGRDLPPWNDTGLNGSGIRWDGGGFCRVINCSFHDNEEGMLITTKEGADILIEGTVMYNNGAPSIASNAKHNIYGGGGGEGGINSFTLQYSWIYNASYTHDVKISARTIKILYNRLGDEITDGSTNPPTWGGGIGNAIDIPKGGLAYIIGNMITKGQAASDSDGNVLRYGEEGLWTSHSKQVYILYNTFNGQRYQAQNNFIVLASGASPAVVANNIFYQSNPSDVLWSVSSPIDNNYSDRNFASWSAGIPHLWSGLVNVGNINVMPAATMTLDFHLVSAKASEVIDQALVPGASYLPGTGPDGFSLLPLRQFKNVPANNPVLVGENRSSYADYGAYANANSPGLNQAPVVSAGGGAAPMLATWSNRLVATTSGVLMGVATDDGLPAPGNLTYTWSKVSGPGTVTFANPNSAVTAADFSSGGTYVLRFQASDGVLSSAAQVTVLAEQAPVVNAGSDQSIAVGATANLAGTASDDGQPTGATLSYGWSQLSGPAPVTFGSGSLLSTTASGFAAAGTYVLQLQATEMVTGTDGKTKVVGLASRDTVTITIGSLVGDIDGDGHVDVTDLLYFADSWARNAGEPGFDTRCDFNGDDAVDVTDLLMLAENWGK